ncbi:hypothetical protein Dimus_018269 [Dionaea muscipula]
MILSMCYIFFLNFNGCFMLEISRYIRKDMLIEVGNGDISPSFNQVLELLLAKSEYLALAPDTKETKRMVNLMSLQFPLLKDEAGGAVTYTHWLNGCFKNMLLQRDL